MLAFNTPPTVPSHIKLKPGVKQEQPVSYRVKIVAHTMIRGVVTYAGSVVEVLREDYKLLGMKCVLVDVNTPLFAAPQPPEPSDLFPAKIVELVGLGLNNPKDLALSIPKRLSIEISFLAEDQPYHYSY